MSTLQVDRIIPYQSSSVLVEGLSAPNLATTGSNTFTGNQNIQGTITASIQEGFALVGGVGDVSTLVATSSFGSSGNFATTGSNTFTGNQTITGSVSVSGSAKQTFNVPTLGNQTDIVVVKGANVNGVPFNQQTIAVQNYDFGTDAYKNAFVIEAWDSLGYNYGGELLVNGETTQLLVIVSGSAAAGTRTGNIAVLDNGNQKTKAVLTGQIIEIGGAGINFTPAIVESITIGRDGVNTVVSGSLTISGSNDFDLVVQGKQSIIGPTTGQVPQLIISSSDFSNTIGRGNISIVGSGSFAPTISISGSSHRNVMGQRTFEISKPGFDYPVFSSQYTLLSSSFLFNYTENLSQTASYTVGVFDNGFTQDVELSLETTTTHGVQFKDIRSDTGAYTTFLKIAPNGGSNPPLEFKRSAEVTGSVNISQVLKLAGQDPLPANGVGQLAVSGSNLYYNNGSSWTQIN
jgi:hypothetical protein